MEQAPGTLIIHTLVHTLINYNIYSYRYSNKWNKLVTFEYTVLVRTFLYCTRTVLESVRVHAYTRTV